MSASLECFFEWWDSSGPSPVGEIWRAIPVISGVEIMCEWAELVDWSARLRVDPALLPERYRRLPPSFQKNLLLTRRNSIHLSELKTLQGTDVWSVTQALNIISQRLNLHSFTTHPDECDPSIMRELRRLTSESVRLSVENMCPRKQNFRSLNSIAGLLDRCEGWECTFDICHWLENSPGGGYADLEMFFAEYGEKICTIHYSVPCSSAICYADRHEINHYLRTGSEYPIDPEFFSCVSPDANWVVEGFIPAGSSGLLHSEISELRSAIRLGRDHRHESRRRIAA